MQDALRESLARLEVEHDHAVAGLFDEHFLDERGAPLLARLLIPGETPRREQLVAEWSAQLPAGGDRYAGDEITLAASDLIVWFEDALHRQDAVRGLLTESRCAHHRHGHQPDRVLAWESTPSGAD